MGPINVSMLNCPEGPAAVTKYLGSRGFKQHPFTFLTVWTLEVQDGGVGRAGFS